jgi:hypothetical protein
MSDAMLPGGLDLVAGRALVVLEPLAWFTLSPGDRPLVAVGDEVAAGTAIAYRHRETHVEAVRRPEGALRAMPEAGGWWAGTQAVRGRVGGSRGTPAGELLYEASGRWHVAVGEHPETLDAPADAAIEGVRPGSGISVRLHAAAIPGAAAVGGPSRGRLVTLPPDGDLRGGSLDVSLAGAIVVVGARVDAETLTRARATGIRGIVVGGLSEKDRRDFLASEARQRAGYHGIAPFAVLALDGAMRRPIATPVRAVLQAIEGREVAIVGDPPLLAFDPAGLDIPEVPADLVRFRTGPAAGREGTWIGAIGMRRFRSGVQLAAGLVRLDDGEEVAAPLGDLERYVRPA